MDTRTRTPTPSKANPEVTEATAPNPPQKANWWSRDTYTGAIIFNLFAFVFPALYGTLSKQWVAKIDRSFVVTTDVYTYIGTVAEVINEGLPRIAYLVIGDRSSRSMSSRVTLSNTLISFQMVFGLIMSFVFLGGAERFADIFVPEEVRKASLTYVRISAFVTITSATEVAVAAATRSLDKPDVPMAISITKVIVNTILDLIFLSPFRPVGINPTVNTQAIIRLCCDAVAALTGLVLYLLKAKHLLCTETGLTYQQAARGSLPTFRALKVLVRPGVYTFVESAFRNAIYLWLVSNVISMGMDYATAWGVFNSIRWGLVMVPVLALDASAVTFVGHYWGAWRANKGVETRNPRGTNKELYSICLPAIHSLFLCLLVEIPLCLFLGFYGARHFAMYLSDSPTVSVIVEKMWKTIDWCYIFYAMQSQLSTILLATRPKWYLYKSFASNLLWDLPWAIALTKIHMNEGNAWRYHAIIFGGSLVQSFVVTLVFVGVWWWLLRSGKARLPTVKSV